MLAKALVIAMAAEIARSDYAKPTLIRSRSREWLIACRWGPEGEYLSIATAGPITDPLALDAPQAPEPIDARTRISRGNQTFFTGEALTTTDAVPAKATITNANFR